MCGYVSDRVFWGASMLGMGFVYNWSGLMAARWFLGLAEAGLFPGVNYYLSCWYKRSEFGVRAVSGPPFVHDVLEDGRTCVCAIFTP